MRSRPLVAAALAALLVLPVSACSEDAATSDTDAVGTSELAPENNGGKAGDRAQEKKAKKVKAKREKRKAQQAKGRRDGTRARPAGNDHAQSKPPGRDGDGEPDSPAAPPDQPGPLSASLTDPTGDVRGTLTGAPPYADLTGATLTRGDVFDVRVSFAGAVPQRQTDDRIVQVATFYDLDGDGQTDYEVWASLADNGWGTSYRTPDGARFGEDSGARARAEGNDLVLTFPLTHLRRADSMAWAVGAQWGTLEQVSTGTTSKDNAPDGGWAPFPR